MWKMHKGIPVWERACRGILYAVILIFLFVGISQLSDRFMESIDLITSQEKEVVVKDKTTGLDRKVRVKVWNKTVANLSLMVLGSSAPGTVRTAFGQVWAFQVRLTLTVL